MKADKSFGAFRQLADGTRLQPIETEVRLVSEVHQFGGTLDCGATIGDDVALLDWKSGPLYADHLYQVGGGYAILWDEQRPDMPITGGFHLCRFNRDNGDFTHHYFSELAEARRGFLLMRDLYSLDQEIRRRVK